MNKDEILLKELILALKHVGLNWRDVLEDYLEYQAEINQKSSNDVSELKTVLATYKMKFNVLTFNNTEAAL